MSSTRRRRKPCKLEVMPRRCPTCPFRPGSPYEALAEELAKGALSTGSRICHSTGRNSLKGNTGKPSKLCRGARNLQLEVFAASGFIEAATDAAWQKKRDELGI